MPMSRDSKIADMLIQMRMDSDIPAAALVNFPHQAFISNMKKIGITQKEVDQFAEENELDKLPQLKIDIPDNFKDGAANISTDWINLAWKKLNPETLIWRKHMPTGEHYGSVAQAAFENMSKSELISRKEFDNAFNILLLNDYSNLTERNYLNISMSVANLTTEFEFPTVLYSLPEETHIKYLCPLGNLK